MNLLDGEKAKIIYSPAGLLMRHIASNSQALLLPSLSPQFINLSQERGNVAAVTRSAHWGERRS